MRILFVAAEAAPFVSTGGLGEVIGSLPKALKQQGVDVRVILPKYGMIPDNFKLEMDRAAELSVAVGWRNQYCGIQHLDYEGIPFYFIDNEYYFKRDGIYGHFDDAERYAFFCQAVLKALPHIQFQPDILHCHDWQAGMVSVFLNAHYRGDPFYGQIKSVYTIHNLKYQGIFPNDILPDLLNLGWGSFTPNGVEFYDRVNFMKGGIMFSDVISTVSPTYAQEIMNPYYGEGLHGALARRKDDMYGIENGIDYTTYDPANDPVINTRYTWRTIEKKMSNKAALQAEAGLDVNPDIPLLAMVSRLVEPKGIDLILRVFSEIMAMDMQFIILGGGERHYNDALWHLAYLNPGRMSINFSYSQAMARKIFAGSDLYLAPSRYEPCGIGQLIAMRYGSLPVVRATGGLKDTVRNYDKRAGTGTGFIFDNYNAHDMLAVIGQAVDIYRSRPDLWKKLGRAAMRAEHSWEKSAGQYISLYDRLINSETWEPAEEISLSSQIHVEGDEAHANPYIQH